MFIKRILKIGLVAIIASALTTVQAQPAPKPDKPTKEKPERGGKYHPPSDAQVTVMQAHISSSELSEFEWAECSSHFIKKLTLQF